MSRIITAPIDLEQLRDEGSLPVQFAVFSYWESYGYPIEQVVEAHSAVSRKQDEEDSGHIVAKVETLAKPLNRADVVEDTIEKWTCDCGAFQYHHNADLEVDQITDWGVCKHIEAVDKHTKAKNDENQSRLL